MRSQAPQGAWTMRSLASDCTLFSREAPPRAISASAVAEANELMRLVLNPRARLQQAAGEQELRPATLHRMVQSTLTQFPRNRKSRHLLKDIVTDAYTARPSKV